jgi:replicative DNA helicase
MTLADNLKKFDYDAEKIVLGVIITFPEMLDEAISKGLKPEHFVKAKNRFIFNFILEQNAPDLAEILFKIPEPYKDYALEVSTNGARAYFDTAIDILTETSTRAVLQVKAEALQRDLQNNNLPISEAVGNFEDAIISTARQTVTRNFYDTKEALDIQLNHIEAIQSGDKKAFFTSGIKDLDEIIGGFRAGEVVIIAGAPSMGKSTVALSVARHIAKEGGGVGIFSLEMDVKAITDKNISALSGLNSGAIRDGRISTPAEMELYFKAVKEYQEYKIFVDDSPYLTARDFRRRAKYFYRKYGLKLIIVDYLQLMSGDKRNGREQEVANISEAIRTTAKELKIPIIALSQLSRAVHQSADKRPALYHLKESGSIEQDAHIVILLYRPEYYRIDKIDLGRGDVPTENLLLLDIAKNRGGALGGVATFFNKPRGVISEWLNFDESAPNPDAFIEADSYNWEDEPEF